MARDPKIYQKEYRERKIAQGLCIRCSNPLAPGSKSRCVEHLAYAKKWQSKKTGVVTVEPTTMTYPSAGTVEELSST